MKKIEHPKVTIIGAGISGLTAGIYALENGFDVSIYEKHTVAGGECTGWTRKGTYIDGCAHWIVGTNPKSDLFPLWKHVGAFDEESVIYPTEYLTKFYLKNGELFTFYANLDDLKKEMLRHFPEDKRMIKNFIHNVKLYRYVAIPTKKPLEYMNIFELMFYGIRMLPMVIPFLHYKHVSMEEYASKFKNKELPGIFMRFLPKEYNIHSFFYVCQAMSMEDAGVISEGSLALANRIKNTFLSKGGKLFLGEPVKEINVEKGHARGIALESGEYVPSDYVISCIDAHQLFYNLLDDKYHDPFYKEKFEKEEDYPIFSGLQISYRTKADISSFDKMVDYLIPSRKFLASEVDHFVIRNFSFDPFLQKNGYTTFTMLFMTNDKDYQYLKSLPREEYLKVKNSLGEEYKKEAARVMNLDEKDIDLLDVTTPLTYERYCNAYKGSYMSFVTTKNSKGLMKQGEFKPIDNLIVSSQWTMPPGGLPVALFSGKHAAIRLCKKEKVPFKNFEKYDSIKVKSLKTKNI